MDHRLDGPLLVPPDRHTILGRSSWKLRHVVISRLSSTQADSAGASPSSPSATRRRQGSTSNTRSFTPKPLSRSATGDEYYISIFKSKDDVDPAQRWPMRWVTDCQVQTATHRKSQSVSITLIVTVSDSRRRRASRAAGLVSSSCKEPTPTVLRFRAPSDVSSPSLHDWARFILTKTAAAVDGSESPISPVFTSPFSTRSRDNSDLGPRPGSSSRVIQHKSSTATYSTGTRDRPDTFSSQSPSLRSKRSDVSSPSSNNFAPKKVSYCIPEQHYVTVGQEGSEFAGWTSAQGYSSIINSPTRGGPGSVGSDPAVSDLASPPAPGETILDRAFQLGHIPGAETYVPGQEKLSSIARFDALMRESDDKRKQIDKRDSSMAPDSALESRSSIADGETGRQSAIVSGYARYSQHQLDLDQTAMISPNAQKALAFIAGRHDADQETGLRSPTGAFRPPVPRAHLSFHASSDVGPFSPSTRPHTSHIKHRSVARRDSSPHGTALAAATNTTPLAPATPVVSSRRHADSDSSMHSSVVSSGADKRLPSLNTKRLGLTDSTHKLPNSSSLLSPQPHSRGAGGGAGGTGNAERQSASAPRMSLGALGSPPPQSLGGSDQELNVDQCGWRGSNGPPGIDSGMV
ncbi:hypothetical protein CDD82_3488 [Ophiocordyceps australis]|uniref:PH domain-containing protein n=1 Tax=Ophiocordyceps australis TaxID=1399860 RepID=A0A2C5Z8Z5_9HYPO|nr:hypothetical protein CDD82_3488 [Ophiocordyceps australis]